MQASNSLTALTLDSSTAIKLTMGNQMLKERALMARNDVWHRIQIIRGARYDKELVLRTILSAIEPADLIPVRYQVSGGDAYFMARNCGSALEMLCRSNLIINIPNGDPTVIIVTLAFASIHDLKINIQPILLAALTKRYDPAAKYLKLDNFHRDSEIEKTVYCPLTQMKTLAHTLKLAKTALGPLEYLNLQHNDLTNLAAMENSNLTSLKGLDLRYNELLVMSSLSALKNLNITELWLDGNPVCENYANPKRYIESAKQYCPNLQKLDGVDLDLPKLPVFQDKYFNKNSNTNKIVEQFLTHFFVIYDHKDRSLLNSLYHKNSFFSLTTGVLQDANKRPNFDPFSYENRNILETSDLKKIRSLLYQGPEEIVKVLKRLPKTLHERKNFRYDIMYEDHKTLLINVEGIFKLSSLSPEPRLYAFSRTFLLVPGQEANEYNILNDQCHVIMTQPITTMFYKIVGTNAKENEDAHIPSSCFNPREKERMIYMMMDVTTMNTEWCHRFLNDANWNPGRAIRSFMDNYKSSNLPTEAFGR